MLIRKVPQQEENHCLALLQAIEKDLAYFTYTATKLTPANDVVINFLDEIMETMQVHRKKIPTS